MLHPAIMNAVLAAFIEQNRNGGTEEEPELQIVVDDFMAAMKGKQVMAQEGVLGKGTTRPDPETGEDIDMSGKHVLMLKVRPQPKTPEIALASQMPKLDDKVMKALRKRRGR